jgi:hypothetical protein
MSVVTIDQVLALIQARLGLSSETEYELLEEIRTHLEDAVADAKAKGEDKQVALLKAAEKFGIDEVSTQLREVHLAWQSADAIIACALPVLFALILRWLIFAPDGSALDWPQLLVHPAFWIVAIIALFIPLLQFRQWRYALIGWGFFWAITIIFVAFPTIQNW